MVHTLHGLPCVVGMESHQTRAGDSTRGKRLEQWRTREGGERERGEGGSRGGGGEEEEGRVSEGGREGGGGRKGEGGREGGREGEKEGGRKGGNEGGREGGRVRECISINTISYLFLSLNSTYILVLLTCIERIPNNEKKKDTPNINIYGVNLNYGISGYTCTINFPQ